jgi:hypothetical protein
MSQETGSTKRATWNFIDALLSIDKFQKPIELNFNRKKSIPSCIGTLMTIGCYIVVAVYAA